MRGRRIAAVTALMFCFLMLFTFSSSALPSLSAPKDEETEEIEETEEELFFDFFAALPDLAKKEIAGNDEESVEEAVGFRRVFSLLCDSFRSSFSASRGLFAKMLGVTLLFCAVGLCGGFLSRFPFAGMFLGAAEAVFLHELLFGAAERTFSAIGDLSAFSMGVSSVYAALFSAGGAAASAAAASGGFVLFTGILESICGSVLLPLVRVLFALVLLSSFSDGGAAEEIAGRVKGVYIFLLSLISVLFTAALAAQSGLASGADSVAFKTVKFAVGSSIPLVGGTVSSVLGSLQASLSLLKGVFGAGSVAALLCLILPVFAELLLVRAALSVCAFVSECFGAAQSARVLSRYRAVFDFLLATVAIVSVLFLIMLAIVGKGFSI